MEITIEDVRMEADSFAVRARFEESGIIVIKEGRFFGHTKEGVERWLGEQAESMLQSMKTVAEFKDEKTEKSYIVEKDAGIMTASAYAELKKVG